jgi:membrane-associated protease RseP (regulator of RpoE activity)
VNPHTDLDSPEPHIPRPWRARGIWIHVLLFIATLATTTALGARQAQHFASNLPPLDIEGDLTSIFHIFRDWRHLASGLPYSLTLLAILLAHEFGHWFACAYYRIDASLPFFIPAPTLVGTMGAFIRLRSPIRSRHQLFDMGIAGPLAGFVFVLPALGIGLALSKVVPGISAHGELNFGTPLILRLAEAAVFPGVAMQDIYLHPVARAAWVGMLATALNLLPIGQLDGGHIVYAAFGEKHKLISIVAILILVPLGFLWWPWWLWALLFLLLGRRHFAVYDSEPLTPERRRLLLVALIVLVLCFIPAPVQYNDGQGLLP